MSIKGLTKRAGGYREHIEGAAARAAAWDASWAAAWDVQSRRLHQMLMDGRPEATT